MIAINVVALAAVFIAVFGFNSVFLIAVGSLISSFVSLACFMGYSNKLISYHFGEQIEDIAPALFSSVVMGGIVYLIGLVNIDKVPLLFLQVVVGGIVYVLLAKLLKIQAFQYLLGSVKKMSKRGAV